MRAALSIGISALLFSCFSAKAQNSETTDQDFHGIGQVFGRQVQVLVDGRSDIQIAPRQDLRYACRLGSQLKLELICQNLFEDIADYKSKIIRDQIVYLRRSGGL